MNLVEQQKQKSDEAKEECHHIENALEALVDYLRWFQEGYNIPEEDDVEKVRSLEETIKYFKLKNRKLWTSIN